MIVMPGFVDAHRRTWRHRSARATVLHARPLLRGHARPGRRLLPAGDVTSASYADALEALNAGVTTLLDSSHINDTPTTRTRRSSGLKDAGIRAVYAHGMPTGGEWWIVQRARPSEDIRRIRETYFSSDDGLLTLAHGGTAARQRRTPTSRSTTGRSRASSTSWSASTSGCGSTTCTTSPSRTCTTSG